MEALPLGIQKSVAIGYNRKPNRGVFGKCTSFWWSPPCPTETHTRGGIRRLHLFKEIPGEDCLESALSIPSGEEIAREILC